MKQLLKLARLLVAYVQERHFPARTPQALARRQQRRLARHLDWLSRQSAYWQSRLGSPAEAPEARLQRLPVVDKASWLASFDDSNTAGLTLAQAQATALRAEAERDFAPTLHGVTVGLSSGTSGSRGVFVVSAAEQAQWAGTVLGRLLPRDLLAGERIAFFLRANSNLYTEVKSRRIAFEFFDLLQDFKAHVQRLDAFRPTVIVAPAQVLHALAQQPEAARWSACTAVSVAEVLEAPVRAQLEKTFARVQEVYQATEGLLAITCEHGRLHLNEEHLWVEREWLDEHRFVPVISDMARRTQPLLRYRLNDVLRVHPHACTCGRATTVLAAIEGRLDDQLSLPGLDGTSRNVFADAISRVLATSLPLDADYELTQTGAARLRLAVTTDDASAQLARAALSRLFDSYGVVETVLSWELQPHARFAFQTGVKRRRIRRLAS